MECPSSTLRVIPKGSESTVLIIMNIIDPGPGSYNPKNTMRDHVTSKFKAECGNTFSHDDRNRSLIKDPKSILYVD